MKRSIIDTILSDKRDKISFLLLGICVLWLFWIGNPWRPLDESLLTMPPTVKSPIRFAMVADKDHAAKSKDENKWNSVLKIGHLHFNEELTEFKVDFIDELPLSTSFSDGKRGLELSELVMYNNKLYTMDDRTGIVFELSNGQLIPRNFITEGNGESSVGQKIEWATIKDGEMIVGSYGKEFINAKGESVHSNMNWIGRIDQKFGVTRENWTNIYTKLRKTVGVPSPGYMIHEAVCYSNQNKKWLMFPRRVSKEAYEEVKDETRGSNIMITLNEDMSKISMTEIGEIIPERGFSSCAFMPGTNDRILATLKSVEDEKKGFATTFMNIIDSKGKILMADIEIPGNVKFEGVEFLTDGYDISQLPGGDKIPNGAMSEEQ
eukprot:TRINITY_DN116_c2_g1_i1.p1 TRINITY_DN116_c2_g1~~TRINITY_DN116_c2_g1_i1.p1  ORF type:complete len:377 (+),score=104.21 TRINITY_DN116_c2_g1_i1:93-1223(+)